MKLDTNSLAYTKYNRKYHIVFAPKYRISYIVGHLKGKSTLMIFEKYANMKYRRQSRSRQS